MNELYKRLFTPINIGKIQVKNRICMAPMGTALTNHEGTFTDRLVEYLVERAKGGVGLIVTGVMKVENEIESIPQFPGPACITLNPTYFIGVGTETTERVHAYGTKIFLQLTPGMGRNGWPMPGGIKPVAPSPIPNYFFPDIICRALETQEVDNIVKKFGEAAEIAATAGFDGIEVHGHSGYMVDQFMMALFNKRTDKYGGDLRGRLTLPIEIMKEIKRKAGANFPVTIRLSLKSYMKGIHQGALPGEEFKEAGFDIEDSIEIAKILEQEGYDGFNCDAGAYDAFYWAHPPTYQKPGGNLHLTERLKKHVKVPVMACGKLGVPEIAAQALVDGKADMIALGRPLLADAYWAEKVMQGDIDGIRPCVGCHDGCAARMITYKPTSCAVNPACGREIDYSIIPSAKPKKVVVVGGGISGMEAARVAAERGHKVTLYEKGSELGGHLIEASSPDFKQDYKELLNWYKKQMIRLKIDVRLNSEINQESLYSKKPDSVVIASGSRPLIPDIPGANTQNAVTATDVLLGNKKTGNSVMVIGGGLVGCEVALWLAQQGKKVTIIEALGDIINTGVQPIHLSNKTMIIDLLRHYKVEILTKTTLIEILVNGIKVETENGISEYKADTIVLALGMKPDKGLFESVAGSHADLYLIGDANKSLNVMHAVWDAYEVGRNL